MNASVTYTVTDDNEVRIEMEATSDATTPISMLNHAYFNLDGPDSEKTILDHEVFINGCGQNKR